MSWKDISTFDDITHVGLPHGTPMVGRLHSRRPICAVCQADRSAASRAAARAASATVVRVGFAAVEVGITPLPPT
jgi:hypothetical protein